MIWMTRPGLQHWVEDCLRQGLASQSRLERCVLHHPHTPNPAFWAIIIILREMGMCLVAYIDDILVLVKSKEKLSTTWKVRIVYLLECLGFVVNKEKAVLISSQTIEFLGLTINTTDMEFQLPLHKIKMIWAESRKC